MKRPWCKMTLANTDRRICHVLSNLQAACEAANTDKVTERKKQVNQIKLELNRTQVIEALNYSSEKNGSKRAMLTWQKLFMMVKEIFVKDVKVLLSAKERQLGSYKKMQQDALQLLKAVVKLACRGTDVKLKPSSVVQLLVELLEDDSGSEMFGVEFSNVVLREMLSKRRYWCRLDKRLAHNLLAQYLRLFNVESSLRFDRCVLSKALYVMLLNIIEHHDLCNDTNLFATFTQYFCQMSDDSLLVIEHMVCAANILCQATAVSHRYHACSFGETIFLPLLNVWKKKPSERLKDELIRFYQLQMTLHHPFGSKQGSDAAFAVDWRIWKRNLLQLYEAIYNDMDEMKSRGKFSSSNSKDIIQYLLKDNLLELTADLCHQLLGDGASVAELTQISQCASTQYGNAAKRRRIETGWMVILDKIMDSPDALHTIPWMQLVIVILRKYPGSLMEEEQTSLLIALQQLLTDCKNIDISAWILKCLLSIAAIFGQNSDSSNGKSSGHLVPAGQLVPSGQLIALWHKVQTSAKRLLNVRHVQDKAFHLFTCLLEKKLLFPDASVWTLFRQGGIILSDASVAFLAAHICTYGIPTWYTSDVRKLDSSLRMRLIDWLLPESDPDGDWTSVERSYVVSASSLASVLVALGTRDVQGALEQSRCGEAVSEHSSRWLDGDWCHMVMNFEEPIGVLNPNRHSRKTATPVTNCSILRHVAGRIMEVLGRDIAYQTENAMPELKMLESMAYQFCLSTKILHNMVKIWNYDFGRLQDLISNLQNLMVKFTEDLRKFILTSGLSVRLSGIVMKLLDVVGEAPCSESLSCLCRMLWPKQLTDLLFEQISETKTRSSSSIADDDIFGDVAGTSISVDVDDCFEVSPSQAPCESVELSTDANDSVSVFSPSLLSEKEKMQLLVVDFLCGWSHLISSCTEGNSNVNIPQSNELLMKQLVQFVDEEKSSWSYKEPYHLQLLQHIVCGLTSSSHALQDHILECLVNSIWLVGRHCSYDQEACCAVVDMIGRLVLHMRGVDTNEGVSEAVENSRKNAVQMHGVFWKRATEGHYNGKTRLAIAKALIDFIKHDPENTWTDWSMKDLDQRMRSGLPRLLKDEQLSVRLFASSAIPLFFGKHLAEKFVPYCIDVQKQVFDAVLSSLEHLLKIKGGAGDEKFPSNLFLTAAGECSALVALDSVIRVSEVCRKRALFVLLRWTTEKHFDVKLVKKMLNLTAICLSYNNIRRLFDDHLPYLLQCWINGNYPIQDFPFQLLDYDSHTAFLRDNSSLIVTQMMVNLKRDDVENVSTLLGTDRRTLLELCLPSLLVHILPLIAADKTLKNGVAIRDSTVTERLPHAVRCHDVLAEELGKEVVKKSILENMEVIVANVLMSLHEREDAASVFPFARDSDPEPNPPHFSTSVVMATLDYIAKSHSTSDISIVGLLAQSQDGIQKVLLLLSMNLSKICTAREKCRLLSIYRFFVHLLMKDFKELSIGCQAFVLRDIVYKLIHCIHNQLQERLATDAGSEEKDDVLVICCDILKMVLDEAIPVCHQEIERHLPTIVGSVVPLVDFREDLTQKCKEIIDLIYVRNSKKLQNAVLLLDPLPQKSLFDDANIARTKLCIGASALREEIEQFLKVGQFYSATPVAVVCNDRIGGLQRLSFQLRSRQQEFENLKVELEQESGTRSLLCDLVRYLVEKAASIDISRNLEFGLELAKCIGGVGLINLRISETGYEKHLKDSSLGPLARISALFPKDVRLQQYYQIFHALSSYLTDPDVETVAATCSVLKRILATKAGFQFASWYQSSLPDDYLFHYLQPFLSSKAKPPLPQDPTDDSVAAVDDANLWYPSRNDHGLWLCHLLSKLLNSGGIKDEILRCIDPMCQSQTKFCELVLPFIVHDILSSNEENRLSQYRRILSIRISDFFKMHCCFYATQLSPVASQGGQISNRESVKTLLNVIQYLRLQERSPNATGWYNNFWLEIDYSYLSQAALNCSLYYTSLLYAEISHLQRGELSSSSSSVGRPSGSQDDAEDINIQNVLLEAYRSISDTDSIYGCAINRQHTDHYARTKMYEHENNWMKALTSHDLNISQFSSDPTSLASHAGLLKSLHSLGCDHLLGVYLRGLLEKRRENGGGGEGFLGLDGNQSQGFNLSAEADIREIQYLAACRSCQWDLEIPNRVDADVCSYSQMVYSSLVGLREKDNSLITEGIAGTRQLLLRSLSRKTFEESENSLSLVLSKFQTASELEDFAQALIQRSDAGMSEIVKRWTEQKLILTHDYEDVESLLMHRCTMLRLACDDQPQSQTLRGGLVESLLMLSMAAREAGRFQVAESALYKLDSLTNANEFPSSCEWRVEKAKLFWAKGEGDTAKYLLKDLINSIEELSDGGDSVAYIYAQCLVDYGNWLAKTRSENPSVILDKYIQKGTGLLEERGSCDNEVSVDAFLSFARFADVQYQTIVDYMRSDTFESKQTLIRQAKEDIDQMKRMADTASRYFRTLEKQRQIDEDELKRLVSDRERFLVYAMQNYVKCLQHHDRHDQYVYRLVSLWFENMTSQVVNQIIMGGVGNIKSQKFISLMYQLAARMSCQVEGEANLFSVTLTQLIESTVADHPHHCLSVILSLANAKMDSEMPKVKARGRTLTASGSQDTEVEEDRIVAAKNMLQRLLRKGGNSRIPGIVANMDRLCGAYVQLANWNVDRYKGETKPINLLDALALVQMKNLENVAVSTVDVQVDPSCEYKDIVSVVGFEPTFTLAGGINLPKIISCRGSDGVVRRQLVKGRDDLRQDAVMQQVFMMVNNLLTKNPATRKRCLKIRTYKVVPLSQRSGILEWCEGTIPMGEYLIGSSSGAHQRYRPLDLKAVECRKLMSKAHAEGSDQVKYNTFRQVCRQFQPVFHHFFMERYQHPKEWYHRRLTYTRSVATNSIVGYILGLGDRHVQNILIDTQTAELIHIDLGVAFEQGRILPTPETVPFRLTRDIVDGMGITGVEGVFRRCCEKTMEVMHSSEEVIITILQVLLYDPLYSWTMNTVKAYQLQSNKTVDVDPSTDALDGATGVVERKTKGDSEDNVNKVAERVLLRLKQKLQGAEDGVQLSINGQVNHLIQEATDPKNLCRLFPGWQAYI